MLASERVRQEATARAAALAGDEAAWRTLYDGACDELWNYALWRCAGLRDLAEDVVQESWLVAVRRLADFDPVRGSFLAWLRGIAALVVKNQLRSRRQGHQALTGNESVPDRGNEIVVTFADGVLSPAPAMTKSESDSRSAWKAN